MGNVKIGRYVSIVADIQIGMHNHPIDWLPSSRATHYPQMHEWHEFFGKGSPEFIQSLRRHYSGSNPVTEIGNDVWIGPGVHQVGGQDRRPLDRGQGRRVL
jgi:acetyltransferase-like isoleucine patch superfamily enzyme